MGNDDAGDVASAEIGSLEGFASEQHGLSLISISNGPSIRESTVRPQDFIAGMLDCAAIVVGVLGLTFELGETAFELRDFPPLEGKQVRTIAAGGVLIGFCAGWGSRNGVGAGRT